MEGKIERRRRERPRMAFREQLEKWVGVGSYRKIKELAMSH